MATGSSKAVWAAMAANGGIAIAKFVGFGMTGAASMLAEGVHSVADTGNQALLLWGGRAARRSPDKRRPFGYGRERYFWAFVVALVMFSMGGLYAIIEGIDKVRHPHPLEQPEWALGILSFGVLLEGASFWIAFRQADEARGEAGWWDFIRRTKTPELPTVLLEDLGAVVGLTLAITGISLAMTTGDPRFDAMGSIAIGLLLVVIAMVLAVEMRSLLIGEAAGQGDEESIRDVVLAEPTVTRLIELRTQHLGPDSLLVGVQVEFDSSMTFPEVSAAIDRIESAIHQDNPAAKFIYVEPACRADDHYLAKS